MTKQAELKWNIGLAGLCLCLLFGAGTVSGQDVLAIGSATADRGLPVLVPVHLTDNTKTTLGAGRVGFEYLIQAFAIQVEAEPEEYVQSMTLDFPEPQYAASAVLYSATRTAGKKAGLVALHSHGAIILDFSGAGRDIAMLNLVVSPSAPVGSTITLSFVAANTMLSNQAGTISETAAQGNLSLQNGIITVSDAPVATTLSISATRAKAAERGLKKGRIQILRVGDLSKKLVVKLKIAGTAEGGRDYARLPTTVTFKKGKSVLNLIVKPIDDSLKERKEKVIVSLRRSKAYRLQKPTKASVIIKDND